MQNIEISRFCMQNIEISRFCMQNIEISRFCAQNIEISRFCVENIEKVFERKLISVLFGILKDKDDYLDATMITREIKSRNPEP